MPADTGLEDAGSSYHDEDSESAPSHMHESEVARRQVEEQLEAQVASDKHVAENLQRAEDVEEQRRIDHDRLVDELRNNPDGPSVIEALTEFRNFVNSHRHLVEDESSPPPPTPGPPPPQEHGHLTGSSARRSADPVPSETGSDGGDDDSQSVQGIHEDMMYPPDPSLDGLL